LHAQNAEMLSVAADIAWSVCLDCVSVCLLDVTVSRTKMVEPINMPFGLWTWVVPRNHVLGVALIPQVNGQFLWGGHPMLRPFVSSLIHVVCMVVLLMSVWLQVAG